MTNWQQFDKKFTRTSKGKDFGKFRDDWFIRDDVKAKDIKDFIQQNFIPKTDLKEIIRNYEYDKEAHSRGECSHAPTICSLIDQEIKQELKKLL